LEAAAKTLAENMFGLVVGVGENAIFVYFKRADRFYKNFPTVYNGYKVEKRVSGEFLPA